MKAFLFILALGLTGLFFCAIVFKDELSHVMAQFSWSAPSETSEVLAGCIGFYDAHKHWPKTAGEIKAGLKLAHRDQKYLPTLKKLTLVEKAGALVVSFTSKNDLQMELHLDVPK